MKKPVFVKNILELGAGTRGSSLGYSAMVMASLKLGLRLFHDHKTIIVETFNEAIYHPVEDPWAKYINSITKSAGKVGEMISEVIQEKALPFIISGDHSNAASTIYAIKNAYPDKRLGVVWVDAHGDLHSPYTTPSGNMHGMPLAISIAEDNLENKRNEIEEETRIRWESLKNLGGICPKGLPQDIVFYGVRDTEKAEDYLIEKYGIKNFTVDEVRQRGIETCTREGMQILKDCDLIYVSFDVDSMDCDLVSRGTGTPVAHGFTPQEVEDIMKPFVTDNRLACFELVEVNPLLDDKGNVMAETAVQVLNNLISAYKSS